MTIKDYIHQNAVPLVVERGQNIYDNQLVRFIEHAKKTSGVYRFMVEGSSTKYFVDIDLSKQKQNLIISYCTCPFTRTYGGICKHVVASLLYLDNNLIAETTALKKRKTDAWFDYADIEKYEIDTRVCKISTYHLKSEMSVQNFESGLVDFKIITKSQYWYEPAKENVVRFFNDKGRLKSKCTCNTIVEGICEHEAAALTIIKNHDPLFFKKALTSEGFREVVEKFARASKLDVSQVEQFLILHLDNRGFSLVPKDNSVLYLDGMSVKNKVKPNTDYYHLKEKLIPAVGQSKMAVGAVIMGYETVNILPVVAKINKAGDDLISSFEILSNTDSPVIFNNPVKGLDDFIVASRSLFYLNSDTNPNENQVFGLHDKLFSLLANFKFVYLETVNEKQTGSYFYNTFKYENSARIVRHKLIRVNVIKNRIKFKYKLTADDVFVNLLPYIYSDNGFEKVIDNGDHIKDYLFLNNSDLYSFSSANDYFF